MWTPCLVSSTSASGQVTIRVGHELIDDYLHFLSGRSRPNSVLAAGYDLKVFFAWCTREPAEVRSKDVINFVAAQRAPRTGTKVVRLNDGGAGLSSRTVARRLSSLSGFYAYLLARGDAGVLPLRCPEVWRPAGAGATTAGPRRWCAHPRCSPASWSRSQ